MSTSDPRWRPRHALAGSPGRTRSLARPRLRHRAASPGRSGCAIAASPSSAGRPSPWRRWPLLGPARCDFDPASGDFDRVRRRSRLPAAVILGILAWSPSRVAARPVARRPAVARTARRSSSRSSAAAVTRRRDAPAAAGRAADPPGDGLRGDDARLSRSPRPSCSAASVAVLVAHAQVVAATGAGSIITDEFIVGFIVTLLASAGMAVVVRVADRCRGARDTARGPEPANGSTSSSGSTGSSPGSMARSRSGT